MESNRRPQDLNNCFTYRADWKVSFSASWNNHEMKERGRRQFFKFLCKSFFSSLQKKVYFASLWDKVFFLSFSSFLASAKNGPSFKSFSDWDDWVGLILLLKTRNFSYHKNPPKLDYRQNFAQCVKILLQLLLEGCEPLTLRNCLIKRMRSPTAKNCFIRNKFFFYY